MSIKDSNGRSTSGATGTRQDRAATKFREVKIWRIIGFRFARVTRTCIVERKETVAPKRGHAVYDVVNDKKEKKTEKSNKRWMQMYLTLMKRWKTKYGW